MIFNWETILNSIWVTLGSKLNNIPLDQMTASDFF